MKIGSGSLSHCCKPAGNATPHTRPFFLYSVWALPASQPRTTHSMGTIFTLRQIMQRPRSMSRSCVEISATRVGSVEIKWSAIIFHSRIRSNQRTEISVSNFPFSAIALGSTTSNALMRSVATTRILGHAPTGALRSYTSRTLPARLPGSARVVLVTLCWTAHTSAQAAVARGCACEFAAMTSC